MRIFQSIAACTLITLSASGATSWYVTPTGAGAKNGTSWANAWQDTTGVAWGSVAAGDTVNFAAGSYSALTVGASGTSGSRITVRAAQDEAQAGLATFAGISCANQDYVTINGGYNGSRNFKSTGNLSAYASVEPKILYCEVGPGQDLVEFRGGSGGEFAYNFINGEQHDSALTMVTRNEGATSYDLTLIHNNTIKLYRSANGFGPDGLSLYTGASVYSNYIYGVAGTTVGAQHQDLIQCCGKMYLKIYANLFQDSSDSYIDEDLAGGTTVHHWRCYNNVFMVTDSSAGTAGVRMYNNLNPGYGPISVYEEVYIDNNTFVDFSQQSSTWKAISLNDLPLDGCTVIDGHIRNNLVFNCGRPGYNAIVCGGCTQDSGWDIDYNLLNAGAHGSTAITVGGTAWTQAHPRTGAPSFVSYTEKGANNDFHLAAGDTAATDQGVTIAYITTDKDGVSRPAGSAYDIGAYEGAGTPNENPFITLSKTTTNFGYVRVGDTRTVNIGITNIGTNTLGGTATGASAPWSITAGGTYSLDTGEGQTLTLQYAPSATNAADSCVITFPGASNAASFSASAKAYPLLSGLTFTPEQALSEQPIIVSNGVAYWTSQITVPANAGRLTMGFLATNGGTYYFTNTIKAPADDANSIYVSIDTEPQEPGNVWDIYPWQSYWTNLPAANRGSSGDPNADEFNPKSWTFSAGTYHRLIICTREPNTLMGTWTLGPPAQPAVTNTTTINWGTATLGVSTQ